METALDQDVKLKFILKHMSNDHLKKMIDDMQLSAIPEGSSVRHVCTEMYGSEGIFVLHVQRLLWPLLLELSSRFLKA